MQLSIDGLNDKQIQAIKITFRGNGQTAPTLLDAEFDQLVARGWFKQRPSLGGGYVLTSEGKLAAARL
jgi:hypothetical protein